MSNKHLKRGSRKNNTRIDEGFKSILKGGAKLLGKGARVAGRGIKKASKVAYDGAKKFAQTPMGQEMINAGLDAATEQLHNVIDTQSQKLGQKFNNTAVGPYIKIAQNGLHKGLDTQRKKLQKRIAPAQTQAELVESFSKMVDAALLNEALGKLATMGLKGAGKAAAKGLKKTMANSAIGGAANATDNAVDNGFDAGQFVKDMGQSVWDDVKQMGSDVNTLINPIEHAKHTFKDENGNWDFNPLRAAKKIGGAGLRTADNLVTGGLGQLAYDAATGELLDDDEQIEGGQNTENEQQQSQNVQAQQQAPNTQVQQQAQAEPQQMATPKQTQQQVQSAQPQQQVQIDPQQQVEPQEQQMPAKKATTKVAPKAKKKVAAMPQQQAPVQQQPAQ